LLQIEIMPAILTITFSPCIDKSTSVSGLIPEKKMRCSAPVLEPGGGGINVARAIKKLGGDATAIYPAGGYSGKYFIKLMADEGVTSVIIETENEARENIIVLDESSNCQFRFGMPGTELKMKECQQILNITRAMKDVEFIVASGSLPPGVPADIFARIAIFAKSMKAKFIVDTSSEALKLAVREGIYLLKPNLGELSSLVGTTYLQPAEAGAAAKQIIEKGKCEVVVVSMGAAGAMLVTKDILENFLPPPVKIKSTVGAGDSMVAGIVLKLSQGKSLEESVQYGVCCGTAATMNPGTELCRLPDVEKLYKAITGEKS
jgi:6-phosphofructokinase 2